MSATVANPHAALISEAEQRAAEQVHVDLTKALCQGAECSDARERQPGFFSGYLSQWWIE